MRFAGQAITIPSVAQNPDVIPGTKDIYYPEDNQPAGDIAQLAPQMTDPWVENPMIQDYDSPYLVTPDIKRLRRGSMNQFIDNPEVLKRTFKGV